MQKLKQQTSISHYFPLYQFWLVPPEVKNFSLNTPSLL